MEVLISIGILSVGLASVVSLIPAGGAAMKASLVDDSRASLESSAVADAINRGVLDRAKWGLASPGDRVIFDAYFINGGGTLAGLGVAAGDPPYGTLNDVNGVVPPTEQTDRVFRGADDLAYQTPIDENKVPSPLPSSAPAPDVISEGRFSWIATVFPHLLPSGATLADKYDLSVVSFYQRPGYDISTADWQPEELEALLPAATDRFEFEMAAPVSAADLKDWVVVGSPILLKDNSVSPPTYCWRTVVMVAQDDVSKTATLTFDRPAPLTGGATHAYVYQGAVGVTTRLVTLEENSSWGF